MQDLELSLFLLLTLVATGLLWLLAPPLGKARWLFLALGAVGVGASILWAPPDAQLQQLKEEIPQIGRAEFTGSDACRSCHPSHYDSWHHSYHRTMTQIASPQAVLAPFDGRELSSKHGSYIVDRQGDWFVVEMVDPDWEASEFKEGVTEGMASSGPRVRLPVVMTTGSHHLQAYWVPSEHGNKLRIFPWVYHIDSQRWIPNGDSFILPPDAKRHGQVWNNNCIRCHSVAGDVGYDPGNWQSQVAELGIACEACHGPGQQHVQRHRNPLSRYQQHWNDQPDPTIVNPRRLSHTKATEVCGQCHCAFDDNASIPYNTYLAGGDYQAVFRLADPHNAEDSRFWSDGTIRVGGREINGLTESACYQRGQMSCSSCHSMHESSPDKQVGPLMETNQACLQCHASVGEDLTGHTHHAVGSSGSLCYNCHMPHTSYALFNAIRSHRIDSPSAQVSAQTGRPNACNQCHIDQTLAWTNERLHQWYDQPLIELNEEQRTHSATLLWLLKGDAAQRVLAAWTLGWEPALAASGTRWPEPFLAQLLDDPYSMVRHVASSSLQKLGRDMSFYDYLAPNATRSLRQVQSVTIPLEDSQRAGLQPLVDADGRLRMEQIERLHSQRDDRPVTLNE